MIRWMLGWILEGSWLDFGWILVGFGEPSWSKNQLKIDKKSIWKDDEIFGGILETSWWHLGGILETFGGILNENKKTFTENSRMEAVGGWAVGSMRR